MNNPRVMYNVLLLRELLTQTGCNAIDEYVNCFYNVNFRIRVLAIRRFQGPV